MSYTALKTIRPFFTNACGQLLAGGKVYTYEPNSLTPKATYKDAAGLTENTNPIVLDVSGEADIYINSDYRFQIFSRDGVLINDVDHLAATQRISSEFIQDPSGMTVAQIVDDVKQKADLAVQQVGDKLSFSDLVNDLTTGGADKALTAKMGKFLFDAFSNSKSTYGYQKLPKGLIFQWCEINLPAFTGSEGNSVTSFTFPMSFPNGPLFSGSFVKSAGKNSNWGDVATWVTSESNSSASVVMASKTLVGLSGLPSVKVLLIGH